MVVILPCSLTRWPNLHNIVDLKAESFLSSQFGHQRAPSGRDSFEAGWALISESWVFGGSENVFGCLFLFFREIEKLHDDVRTWEWWSLSPVDGEASSFWSKSDGDEQNPSAASGKCLSQGLDLVNFYISAEKFRLYHDFIK